MSCLSSLTRLGIIGATLLSTTAVQGVQESLVAYYPFEGNYIDASGNGHDGVSEGTWESFGPSDPRYHSPFADLLAEDAERGGVYQFSNDELRYDVDNGGNPNNNRLNIDATVPLPALGAGENVSMAMWVRRDPVHRSNASKSWDFCFLAYLGRYGNAPIFSVALGENGEVYAYFEGDGDQVFLSGTQSVPADTWTHLVVTIDRQNDVAKAYINGVEEMLSIQAGNPSGGTLADISSVGDGELDWTRARIGNNDGADCGFMGKIDEFRLYYTALDADAALDLMQDYPIDIDFNTFTAETWPSFGFSTPDWQVTDGGTTAGEVTNSNTTVFYGDKPIVDRIIRGSVTPGGDDDMVGLALGFQPGDTANTAANFLLLDWKGNTQTYDFTGDIHERTGGGVAEAGLALSLVHGIPTADELWAHRDDPANPDGGVTELARAATLGASDYDSGSFEFEIIYTAESLIVNVNGVEEFNLTGAFPTTGTLALYELAQNPGASFSTFRFNRIGEDFEGSIEPDPLTENPPNEASAENPYGLTAYVFENQDGFTRRTGAAELLRRAGFHVEALPLDRGPVDLATDPSEDVDLIFFGSFASESEDYQTYMTNYGDLIADYIDRAGLFVQFAQADQTEPVPTFLPDTQDATRKDDDFSAAAIVTPDNPLLAGLPLNADGKVEFHFENGLFWEDKVIFEAFDLFFGFQVLLAADKEGRSPGLMEGAYGQGRFIMSAMATDKIIDNRGKIDESESVAAFNEVFFANLYEHAKNVRDLNAGELENTPAPGESELEPGGWTLALLPDTQIYAQNYPGLFFSQTGWIADHARKNNIRYVLHLGDIVNVNSIPEWKVARGAFGLIDNIVPYGIVPGNHDYGPGGNAATRDTYMNLFFKEAEYRSWPTFGGPMETGKMDNTYHLFEAWGAKWIAICLEWGPRDSTIEWARGVLDLYPDRYAILVTHAYMNNNDLRYDISDTTNPQNYNPHFYSTPGGVNDGEELWQKLVKDHNFIFTFNGHVLGDGTGYRVDTNDLGNDVHQMLVNYQFRSLGGEGYFRLLEFLPDGKTVRVKSYSTIYNNFLLSSDQDFEMTVNINNQRDEDNDGVLDYHDEDFDWDGDGLDNRAETEVYGTSNFRTDTDGDGASDGAEVAGGSNPAENNSTAFDFVQENSSHFGLFSLDQLQDLNVETPLIKREDGQIMLQLQLETSEDGMQTWTPAGDPVEWTRPASENEQVFRVNIQAD